MDHALHLDAFLVATVNLRPWKLTQLDGRVISVRGALEVDATYGPRLTGHSPQGSWAHQTIIEPVGDNDEFDADFLLHVEERPDWKDTPGEYLSELRAAFKRSSTYKDKIKKKNRCVRVVYANSCHIDVVPCITQSDGTKVIVNAADNQFEETNPEGFTAWMHERDDLAQGNLRRVIRLLKYLRDYKNTFTCPSVILTTLVGERVQPWHPADRYADTAATLVHLLEDLDEWLSSHEDMPLVADPSCPGVSFNHRWEKLGDVQTLYQNFKTMIGKYAAWAREAYDTEDDAAALKTWQKLFGDEFVAVEVEETKRELAKTDHRALARVPVLEPAAPGEEFVWNLVTGFQPRYSARIEGRVLNYRGFRPAQIRDVPPLRKNMDLKFTLFTDAPAAAEVWWKVRNRGAAAQAAGDLRGQVMNRGSRDQTHTERTKYKGRHYIEVYVVIAGTVVASDHYEVEIG